MRTLVLIHGRSQQGKRDMNLKHDWLQAFRMGLTRAGLELDLKEDAVRFPFYGDTLDMLARGGEGDAPDVVIQSAGDPDAAEEAFVAAMVEDAVKSRGITPEQVRDHAEQGEVVELGIQNWPWVLAALRALENVPGTGAASLALATRDVYQYLHNPGIQTKIETGVREAFDGAEECVVVGHSLGSVVAYNVLARRAATEPGRVPSLITVGSPLAVRPVLERLAPVSRPAGVQEWFNAYDRRDVVSLHPLDATHFPVQPEVENYGEVDNPDPNRHGISGYLSDPVVARRLYDALLR